MGQVNTAEVKINNVSGTDGQIIRTQGPDKSPAWMIPGSLGATCWVVASNAKAETRAFAAILQASGYPVWLCYGTDDHIEIQLAINALPATGGLIILSEGQFNAEGAIDTGTKDCVTIKGQGGSMTTGRKAATLIRIVNGANLDDLFKTDTLAQPSGLVLQDFGIDGNKENQTGGNGVGINWTRVFKSRIENVDIEYMYGTGLLLKGLSSAYADRALEITLSKVYVRECPIGVKLDQYSGDNHANNIIIADCVVDLVMYGQARFSNSHFYGHADTINILQMYPGSSESTFINTYFDTAQQHLIVIDVTTGLIVSVIFDDCSFYSPSQAAVNTYDAIYVKRDSGSDSIRYLRVANLLFLCK